MNVQFPTSALMAAASAAANATRAQQIAPTATAVAQTGQMPGLASATGGVQETGGFASVLSNTLQEVSRLQNDGNRLQQQFQLGVPGASLEQTMLTMQKGQLAFQAALTLRNRLVSAYTDIMNMQV